VTVASTSGTARVNGYQLFPDCNGNGKPDSFDISSGFSQDSDGNGVPDECESIGTPYCVGAPNSVGDGSRIGAEGTVVVADNNFTLLSYFNPVGQNGIFYFGSFQIQTPFGNGFRCVSGSIRRLAPVVLTNGTGSAARALNFNNAPENQILAGSTIKFQWWYRDPMGGGARFNLSDGLSVTFQ
jgi:hypothetical protein